MKNLRFDYGIDINSVISTIDDCKKCYCDAVNCRGLLPFDGNLFNKTLEGSP